MADYKIECRLCGLFFDNINGSHLGHRHSTTLAEYVLLFPDAPLESEPYKKKMFLARSANGKANKGLKRTDKFCERRSLKYTGEGNPFYDKTHSEETRKKLSAHFQGISEEVWERFSKNTQQRLWKSKRAKRWSREVFERDNFTCAMCNRRGRKLEAHHIIPRAKSPERVYDIDNGITLCQPCHRQTFRKEMEFSEKFFEMIANTKLRMV